LQEFFGQKEKSKAQEEIEAEINNLKESAIFNLNTYNDALAKNDYSNALVFYKEHSRLSDSLIDKEKIIDEIVIKLQNEYDRNAFVIKYNEEKRMTIMKVESRKQKNILLLLFILSVIVLFFAVFLFNSLRKSRQKKLIIISKNEEAKTQMKLIEEKNRELLDSIHYAKRIQTSLLPTNKYIVKHLINAK
jgi:hypothetical protein